MADHEPPRLGVIGREQARAAAQTVPDAEAEAYRLACVMADTRRQPRPDREAHRRAFYARHDHPTKETSA